MNDIRYKFEVGETYYWFPHREKIDRGGDSRGKSVPVKVIKRSNDSITVEYETWEGKKIARKKIFVDNYYSCEYIIPNKNRSEFFQIHKNRLNASATDRDYDPLPSYLK